MNSYIALVVNDANALGKEGQTKGKAKGKTKGERPRPWNRDGADRGHRVGLGWDPH